MKNVKLVVIAAIAFGLGSANVFAGSVEDAALTAKVKTALATSPAAKAYQIDVESKDGVVQIKGYVDTADSISAAATVVRGVAGVSKVENNLKVKPAERTAGVVIDDTVINTKVKSALLAEPVTKGLKIDVDTRKGVVQLNGFVASTAEKNRAESLAVKVEGVRSVENNLTVRP